MATTSGVCPVCRNPGLVSTVTRSRLPAMQNYVFRRADLARAAKSGQFDLCVCRSCGFAHNACFDPALLDYDEGYDNSVPSSVMMKHYRDTATYLHEKYSLDDGLVLDIGCGKGTFLKVLCETFPAVRGLGIDPSYEGDSHVGHGRVAFVKEVFSAKHIGERPSLVVCRHVLEHIPDPAAFLRSIRSSLEGFQAIPLFFEVPDTMWIIENNAFWDFCYEHCNYFTADSLWHTLEVAGFVPHTRRAAFGDQYVSIEASNRQATGRYRGGADRAAAAAACFVDRVTGYCDKELGRVAEIRETLQGLKREGWAVAIWGMATKGVVFSFLVDPGRTLIDFCIDVNQNKQGCFVPVTGHSIQAPEALTGLGREPLAIVVMNANYLGEIRETCKTLALSATFMDANGKRI